MSGLGRLGDYGLGNMRDLGKMCPRDKWNRLAWVLLHARTWVTRTAQGVVSVRTLGYAHALGSCIAYSVKDMYDLGTVSVRVQRSPGDVWTVKPWECARASSLARAIISIVLITRSS
jgi:hypothetical protein